MRLPRLLRAAVFGLLLVGLAPPATNACSPPFEEPTIRALGPAQIVLLGRTGERVTGGRLFHVERSFNAGQAATPIVIAFKEGEPVGDCSYPVPAGQPLIIAPYREPDGRLSADLGTLQADPASERGRRYLAEAIALFGPGNVPTATTALRDRPEPGAAANLTGSSVADTVLLLAVGMGIVGLTVGLVLRWQRRAPH